ncbi:MAG: DUF1365 family protein [Polaribacter sp.]|jgi:DUF1365 family protein
MKSRVYFGHIRHSRITPKKNRFNNRICMFYIDIDELSHIFDRFLLWSVNRFNAGSFNSKNYLCDENGSIREAVKSEIGNKFDTEHNGPIRILTHLSYFGHCFNPVTFYYCFNKETENLDFLLAQINNTPWDERFSYVFDNREGQLLTSNQESINMSFDKEFHVSPFLPMEMKCHWRFMIPNERLTVYMKNTMSKDKVFDACLLLKGKPITSASLARVLVGYPLMTIKVVSGIYWQALRLWIKRVPFHSNPKPESKSESNNSKLVKD